MTTTKHVTLCALLVLCALSAHAYDFEVNGIYYNVLNEMAQTCEVTGLSSDSSNAEAYTGNVVIPETTTYLGKTYSVAAIGAYAFYYCSGLTGVTIPTSATSIGDYVFCN